MSPDEMLPRLEAVRYVQPLREGGSLPAIVDTEDGLFVVKFRGAGQGPKALLAELIVGLIAREIGLATPDLALIHLDERFGLSEPDPEIQDLLRASHGTNVGLRFLDGAFNYAPSPASDLVAPEFADAVVWLDAMGEEIADGQAGDRGAEGGEAAHRKEQEEQEIEERTAPHARVVYEAIRAEGREELERPASALFWSAIAAGLSMGFSFAGEALIHDALPAAAWAPLVSKVGYTVGFVIVILGRQQLFTENTLTAVLPLLSERRLAILAKTLRLWGVVLLANLVGALLFALVAARTGAFRPELEASFSEIAGAAVHKDFGTIFVRAIFAGWLIALMVWLLPYAEVARFWVVVLITYVVGLGEFDHIIIGSVEGFYLALRGMVGWGHLLGGYMLPTLVGNILGGVVLVALLAHAQVEPGRDAEE